MPDSSTLLLFALASAILVAAPGPAVVYIVTRSIAQGRRAGILSALGVEAGAFVHVVAAAAGLSAIVASSAAAFSVVKYAGAAYLIGLGLRRLLTRSDAPIAHVAPVPGRRLFTQGIVVNVLNPKVAIFFLAFLPQFVDPGRGAVAVQALELGVLFIAVAATLDCTWALLAGAVGERLRRSARARRGLDRASGASFVGLGVVAALARP